MESEDKEPSITSNDEGVNSDVMNDPCVVCCLPGNEEHCLLCDTCGMTMHHNCVRLNSVPEGGWSCPWCEKKAALTSKEVLLRC